MYDDARGVRDLRDNLGIHHLKDFLRLFVDVRDDDEVAGMLWATVYGFMIMVASYIMRPVRDEISANDKDILHVLWSIVALVMLVVVPVYSWVNSRMSRAQFVPWANRFFILCLVGFWIALLLLPESSRPWIDRVFYVWMSVFNLFVVSVFWGFMADCFTTDQGKRLFAFIAVGSSIGAYTGAEITSSLALFVPVFALLLMACVPLEVASWCCRALDKRFGAGDVSKDQEEAKKPVKGGAWSGMAAVMRSPYLMGIAGFILLMTFASGMLYFQKSYLLEAAIDARDERIVFLADIEKIVQVITVFLQVYLSARIVRWFGVSSLLVLTPIVVALGFIGIGLYPTLFAVVLVETIYRSFRYGVAKPGREMLWTVLPREDKYKAKPFIDSAVYRGGDVVWGWTFNGFVWIGLSIAGIALIAAPVVGVWAVLALSLGKAHASKEPEAGGNKQRD